VIDAGTATVIAHGMSLLLIDEGLPELERARKFACPA